MKSQPHGFSFFNNVGLAANYLTQTLKVKKVAIVDWDVHHG
jgi:acetoin utilization deacetylase AcuC-like enzyme